MCIFDNEDDFIIFELVLKQGVPFPSVLLTLLHYKSVLGLCDNCLTSRMGGILFFSLAACLRQANFITTTLCGRVFLSITLTYSSKDGVNLWNSGFILA